MILDGIRRIDKDREPSCSSSQLFKRQKRQLSNDSLQRADSISLSSEEETGLSKSCILSKKAAKPKFVKKPTFLETVIVKSASEKKKKEVTFVYRRLM